MTRRRWFMAAGIAALAALIIWVFYPRPPQPPPGPPADAESEPVGAEFTQARIIGRQRGQRQWEVETRRVLEESEEWVRAESIDSGTLYRDGSPYLDIRAHEARSHRVTNDLTLVGDVVAVHVEGAVFRTDRAEWTAAEEQLVAPGPVTIERDGDYVEAQRMVLEWDEDTVYLYDQVYMRRASGAWLRADRVEYELDGEVFRVRGPFRAALPAPERRAGSREAGGSVREPAGPVRQPEGPGREWASEHREEG